ncbi:nucleotide exchange factor GrpE [Patescibacteria group bacterium]|nr:nucleotide exchange factor GrpE [Patescibacteria group bacterium]MCG2701571.1 nucleotide exchange factor GrpE [Candidatus Parcubacteria bacterium]MBU4210271.1 nucleotide exchange factor GrpE [Patescibacteria group bacterium]MBU4264461.1 nucleotide exchange factor GrpE [Patescibacteria group bacterium]MBU4390392.1 nucleotide exchange factor GrpE [Patescibacteria group bacterium]
MIKQAKHKPKIKKFDSKSHAEDLKEQLKRSLADYSNLEKRIESQRQLYATLAVTSVFDKLLNVLDDFYLVQKNIKNEGLKMALDKLQNFLASEGLEEINALNKVFDPSIMDCVEVTCGKQNCVLKIHKKGYKLNGQVIRPVQVAVGKSIKNKN